MDVTTRCRYFLNLAGFLQFSVFQSCSTYLPEEKVFLKGLHLNQPFPKDAQPLTGFLLSWDLKEVGSSCHDSCSVVFTFPLQILPVGFSGASALPPQTKAPTCVVDSLPVQVV